MINHSSQFNLGLLFSKIATLNSNIAIKDINDRDYTFEEIEKCSNKIANFLLNNSFKKGDRIAFFNDKDFISYSFMIASLKIGCIYTNLDRNIPESRLVSILNQIKPKLWYNLQDKVTTEKNNSLKNNAL